MVLPCLPDAISSPNTGLYYERVLSCLPDAIISLNTGHGYETVNNKLDFTVFYNYIRNICRT
jgi:hypothetical protein